jgi:hypothetical protein
MRITSGSASLSSGDSLRLPGAATNGAITLQWRSQKATTLSPFTFWCPLKPRLSPPFFRRRRGAVAVNDRGVEEAVLMKPQHRVGKNGVQAAVGHPAPADTVNSRVVNFNKTFAILVNRKLLPRAAQLQMLQNVVEYLVKTKLRCRTTAAGGEVRQDKLLEGREIQLRRNRLPALIFSHSGPPENGTMPDSLATTESPGPGRPTAKFNRLQKPATSWRPPQAKTWVFTRS